MNDIEKRYTIRINRTILDKLGYISEYDGRSKNKEINYLIKNHIMSFEKNHGEITEYILNKFYAEKE